MMDQPQARGALLKISLVTVALTSWVFVSFIFSTRPEGRTQSPPEAGDALVSLVRLPASLPGMPSEIPKLLTAGSPRTAVEKIRMDVLKVPCWDVPDEAERTVESRWVRLTGRPCQTDASVENIEVRNVSNGYAGTVFSAHKDALTTDFIPLEEGRNEILVKIGQGEGLALESRFTLVKSRR